MPTRETPTEEGWYWMRTPPWGDEVVYFDPCNSPGGDGEPRIWAVEFGDQRRLASLDPDGWEWEGPIPPMDALARWRAERGELLAALGPFARVAPALDGEPDATIYDGWYVLEGRVDGEVVAVPVPSVGDVRRAAEAYRRATRPPGGGSERGDCEGP